MATKGHAGLAPPPLDPAAGPSSRVESDALRRLNRTLRALSNSSHALLHAVDEEAHLQEVCRIVVEDCGHAMVWIGYAEDDAGKTVRPVAHAGFESGYLETLRVTWEDSERGRGPTGTAIRTGRPSSCRNMLTDPRFAPWREEAVRRGYASSIVLPLMAGGRAFGAITIYSRDPDPFLEDEQKLLEELANDLAFGITTLRERAARQRAEAAIRDGEARLAAANEALRESERRYRDLAESLQEADVRKNEFLGVLSHELRNPLAPIQSALHILDRAPPGSDKAQRAREVIRRQADHMARLVDDLLDVTRISHGKIQLRRGRVELGELAARVVEDHRSLYAARAIGLDLRAEAGPLWVDADAVRISQAIANLLQNAAKFTNAGGHVAVVVGRRGGTAIVRVTDDGIGISAEVLRALFQPFRQADESLHRSAGGLGLGLALVKGLVELHGGTVEGRSDGIGRGAEFTISLPSVAGGDPTVQAAQAVQAAPSATDRRTRRRMVVIDDSRDCADTLKEVLELSGHDVAVVYDGREGLAMIRARRPDVVFCDIGLPGIDGYEVARRIKADPQITATLIALSGYALVEDKQKAIQAGFDHHLGKPLRMEELNALLERIARSA